MKLISPVKYVKNRVAGLWPPVYDALFEDSDGGAVSRRGMLIGNYFASIASTLVSGIYFTGLLIAMNAGDAYIGYITVATTACGFIQMLSPVVLERMKKRKTFLLCLRAVYYLINIFVLGAVPVLPFSHGLKLGLFMAAVILMNLVSSFASPGYSIWHMQCLPESKRARFFSISSVTGSILSALATFSAGLLVDGFEKSETEFGGISPMISAVLVLRGLALVAAVLEFYFFMKIREQPYLQTPEAQKGGGIGVLLIPLKDRKYLATASVAFLWAFATAIIGSYYSVYLLQDLKISYAFLSSLSVVAVPLSIIFTPVWAGIIRRTSWLRALYMAMFFYAFAYLGNVFVTAKTALIVYPAIVVWCYLFSPGVGLVFSNLPYLKMPESGRTAYLGFYSTVNSLASVLGAYLGTLIITATPDLKLKLFGFTMVNKQYINLLQFALILGIAFYVRALQRRDAAKETAESDKAKEKLVEAGSIE